MHRGSESAKVLLQQSLTATQRKPPMPTECSADLFGFAAVEGREVVAGFDGGTITSDAVHCCWVRRIVGFGLSSGSRLASWIDANPI